MSELNQHIKQNLEQREIQPSQKAWENLENLLDENNPTQIRYSTKFWLGLAASVLLIFLTVGIFILEKNSSITDKQVVKEKYDEKIKVQENSIDLEKDTKQTIAKSELEVISTQDVAKQDLLKSVVLKQPNSIHTINSNDEKIVEKVEKKPEIMISQKSIVASDTLKSYKLKSSDVLLADALKRKRNDSNQIVSVNRKNLLDQVEDDIYAEKSPDLLEKLTEKVKSIQVALSNRNKE